MYLSTFMLEEARHSEFFAVWHAQVPGLSTPAEKASFWPPRDHTVDPTGRFTVGEPVYEGLPKYGRKLSAAVESGVESAIEGAFVQVRDALLRLDRGRSDDALLRDRHRHDGALGRAAGLRQGFKNILGDEGRHITFGTQACKILIEKNPAYEALAHEVIDEYRANAVGMLEYQRKVPGLDLDKYQRPERSGTTSTAAARWGSSPTSPWWTRSSIQRSTSS
jgi:hypothetical protein